jgi:ABC-2 type transport system permease protein
MTAGQTTDAGARPRAVTESVWTEMPRGLSARLQELGGLSRRFLIVRRREKLDLTLTVLMPAFWLVFFGLAMGRVIDESTLGAPSYIAFALPAVVVMTAVTHGINGSLPLLWDRETGYLHVIMSMPIARGSMLGGCIVMQVVLGTFQVLFVIVVGRLAGVSIEAGAAGVVVILVAALLLIVSLTALFASIAYALPGFNLFVSLATVATLPLVLMSNAFVPLDQMPDWMSAVAHANPLTYATSAMRSVVLDGFDAGVVGDLAVVTAFSVVATGVGLWQFRRVTKERAP